jgi:D-glycero-D-manno-heptose 1,7-bisphosphate phosphatase
MRKPVALFDRDGVLNDLIFRDGAWYSPLVAGDFHIAEGAVKVVQNLKALGFVCVVVTNQPEVQRGRLHDSELALMNAELETTAGVDMILVCPHDKLARCRCRKPNLGLFHSLETLLDIDLSRSFMVGDRVTDLIFAQNAGVVPVLLRSRQTEMNLEILFQYPFVEIQSISDLPDALANLRA